MSASDRKGKERPLSEGAASSGGATEAKQDTQVTNQGLLYSLTQTLQELVQRLSFLAAMANSGAPALRVMGLTGSTTAVTGSLTSAGTVSTVTTVTTVTTVAGITNLGGVPAYTTSVAQQNLNAVQSNIINVIVS